MSKAAFAITLFLTVLAGAILAAWPEIDIYVAQHFFVDGAFAGRSGPARAARSILYYGPFLVPLGMLAAWAAPRLGFSLAPRWIPRTRTLVFLALSLALAPGVLVNGILKEHSNRPRPVHLDRFAGSAEFRPWYRFDGSCRSNCSFVSGEVSTAAWLAAPASLLPPPARVPAMAGALAVATATGALRMAFGGHFLSDVVMAILLTLLVCQALAIMILPKPRE